MVKMAIELVRYSIFLLVFSGKNLASADHGNYTRTSAESGTDGYNILLMFQGCGTQTSLFNLGLRLGQELQSSGHNVSLVVTHMNKSKATSNDEDLDTFHKVYINSESVVRECKALGDALPRMSLRKTIGMQQLLHLVSPLRTGCETLLTNQTALEQLRQLNLNMIISDSFCPCHVILSQLLGGGISLANFLIVSPQTIPPAIFPQTTGYNHGQSFFERVQSTLERISVHIFYHRLLSWYIDLASHFQVAEVDSRREFAASYGNVSLWFINGDPVLDYPMPVPPNFVFLGDLTSHSPRPIVDEDLAKTLKQINSKGYVIVSISTILRQLRGGMERRLIEGLERLPFHTLWRNTKRKGGETQAQISKIHYTGWLDKNDMNDLLGLNGTVAFVTTGGRCGIFEAIYHGVPVLCLPLYSEHYENCAKLAGHGMGIVLDIRAFTADEIYDAIFKLTHDKSYKENAMRASRTFASNPQTAGDRAAFWVKHVIQNGDPFIKPITEMSLFNLFRYMEFDVSLAIIFAVIAVPWIIWNLFKRTCTTSSQQSTPMDRKRLKLD